MDFPFDTDLFHQAFDEGNIVWRKHILERLLLRGITRDEVLKSMKKGEIIQVYDYDRSFPSILLLGFPDSRPIHVVASFDGNTKNNFRYHRLRTKFEHFRSRFQD